MTLGSYESERGITLRPPPNPNLGGSQFLLREEVLRRRSHRAKQLLKVYRSHYWSLVDEIRVKHRDYYWEKGKSPLERDEEDIVNGEDGERKLCGFVPCKSKAMPLTRFCHQHILNDGNQRLYKACVFVTKSAQGVHITCRKPVLRATVPSLCPGHRQKVQKQISTALKKVTCVNSSSKAARKFHVLLAECARKFHVLLAECAREIKARRRKALNANGAAHKITQSDGADHRWNGHASSGGWKLYRIRGLVTGKSH